jgi:hypothetical protein
MSEISIQNETEYDLTETILDQIKRDAVEYFGESVNGIRIQYGIERHAFNAKTGQVRYAFSPNDFGLVNTTSFADLYTRVDDVPRIDDVREDIETSSFDDGDDADEDEEVATFGTLDVDLDGGEDDESPEFKNLDSGFTSMDDMEDNEQDYLYDDYDN